jgi:hypothetical protein
MSGFTEHQASDAGATSRQARAVLKLGTAQQMVPLIQHIVADILQQRRLLAKLSREQDLLDEQRRTLHWPQRRRRYEVHEECAGAQRHLEEAMAELGALGAVLVDADSGQIGLPTMVNDRAAFFSWKPGEKSVQHWHFAEETNRRAIPSGWCETVPS